MERPKSGFSQRETERLMRYFEHDVNSASRVLGLDNALPVTVSYTGQREDQSSFALPERTSIGIVKKGVVLGDRGGYSLDVNSDFVGEIPWESPLIRDVHTVFTLEGFERPRAPFGIGQGDLSRVEHGTEFFGLPIKFPGTEYRVPNELECISAILELCASFEGRVNPHVNEYYTYLSLYRTYISTGERQLTAGLHSDGVQGRRIEPKLPIEHGYAVTDSYPTHFFPQAFDMTGIDVNVHLLDAVFESQVDRDNVVTNEPGTVIFFDAYCVHQAVPAADSGWRAFLKVMYTPRQYDRLGNAVNQLFTKDYDREGWEFQPRPIPQDLTLPDSLPQ